MLEEFIKSNFETAVEKQEGIILDNKMIKSIQEKSLEIMIVKKWMQNYGLFQGIQDDLRIKIVKSFINFVNERKQNKTLNISTDFKNIHSMFYEIKQRKWLSATSKLLWCMYPNEIVIYDAFVERVILVLQCMDEDLAKCPRINYPPNAKKDNNSILMTLYYLNYQNLVKIIFDKNIKLINDLKKELKTDYKYNLRIFDKLLWIMGNFKSEFKLNNTICSK